jgi:hypothetical protein
MDDHWFPPNDRKGLAGQPGGAHTGRDEDYRSHFGIILGLDRAADLSIGTLVAIPGIVRKCRGLEPHVWASASSLLELAELSRLERQICHRVDARTSHNRLYDSGNPHWTY